MSQVYFGSAGDFFCNFRFSFPPTCFFKLSQSQTIEHALYCYINIFAIIQIETYPQFPFSPLLPHKFNHPPHRPMSHNNSKSFRQRHQRPLLYLQESSTSGVLEGTDSNGLTMLEQQLQAQQQSSSSSSTTSSNPAILAQETPNKVQGATAVAMEAALTTNKQLHVDVGTQFKTFLRAMTIGLAVAYALQQSNNGFQHNTHFRSIYVTCLFVAGCQTVLGFFVGARHLFSRNLLFMIELFLDFFSFAIATLIGSIATARCEQDSPVKPCFHAIMRAPLIGCTIVGTMSLFIFTLTLLRK